MLNSNSDLYEYLLKMDVYAKQKCNKSVSDRLTETIKFFGGGSSTEFLSDVLDTLIFTQKKLTLEGKKYTELSEIIKQLKAVLGQ